MQWTRGDAEGQKDETATEAGGIGAEVRGRGWSCGRVGDLGVQSWGLPSPPAGVGEGLGDGTNTWAPPGDGSLQKGPRRCPRTSGRQGGNLPDPLENGGCGVWRLLRLEFQDVSVGLELERNAPKKREALGSGHGIPRSLLC